MSAEGNDPEQPRQPHNFQGLLKFALEATKSEDAPNDTVLGPLDEERKKFLEEALKSLTINVVEELEKAMKLLLDPETPEEDKEESIETVIDFVQDIDAANDFYKIGGFCILMPGLNSPNPGVRAGTLKLIGELSQNNPFCQKHLLDLNVLPKLVELLSDVPQVSHHAMHASSCMVRQYEPCLAAFIDMGGLECILGCIQSDSEKLRIKSAFLMSNLCSEFAAVRDEFVKLDAVERTIVSIEPTNEYDIKLETALSSLCVLTENKDAVKRSRDSKLNLKRKLETILKMSAGKSECEEQLQYSKDLLKRCFSIDRDSTDR